MSSNGEDEGCAEAAAANPQHGRSPPVWRSCLAVHQAAWLELDDCPFPPRSPGRLCIRNEAFQFTFYHVNFRYRTLGETPPRK